MKFFNFSDIAFADLKHVIRLTEQETTNYQWYAVYLVVIKVKRGTEAQNPVDQCYAQMLAAARLNWEQDKQEPQTMFGCYTIADTWTFIRAEVADINTDTPAMQLKTSREYVEKFEAEIIVRILKKIVLSKQKSLV